MYITKFMENLIQIAAFSNEIEMSLIRNNLENLGVETFVKDEHVNALKEFSIGGIGGVKILVKQKDYKTAMYYLLEIGYYKTKDFEPTWLEKFLQKYFG